MEINARERVLIKDIPQRVGEEVKVFGWVASRRDMGKIIFIDLRDGTGLLQVVFAPGSSDLISRANNLRGEFVVAIRGRVNARPEKNVNPNIITGRVELEALDLEILTEAKTPPFELDKDTSGVNEETRLKYRYLDLRSERMHKNILLRSKMLDFVKSWLHKNDFIEIETPYLTKGTPEGSREFVVPSRLHPEQFYVLPQSPQQFKQLLMIAGMEKYFQIARCFRDEDQRGDRQPEFTQVDIEMSFVDQEDVMSLTEEMMIQMVREIVSNKRINQIPFRRMPYAEALEKYGTDKPDLRENKNDPNELAFVWITDTLLFEYSETEKRLVSAHHPFTRPYDEDIEMLETTPEKVRAYAYDLVLNGYEIWGGSIRIHRPELQRQIFDVLGISFEDAEKRFGHMLEAFMYGAPPHGGIAAGFDRIAMILAGEPNIREVMAFPKTGDARDPMMGAPSDLPEKQLKEVFIKTIKSV